MQLFKAFLILSLIIAALLLLGEGFIVSWLNSPYEYQMAAVAAITAIFVKEIN